MGFITQTNAANPPPLAAIGNNTPGFTFAGPIGVEAGDMLICMSATSGSPTTAITPPTGGAGTAWTNLTDHQMTGFTVGADNGRVRLDYRQATAADNSATFTLSPTGGSGVAVWMLCVRSTDAAYASLVISLAFAVEIAAAATITVPQIPVTHPTDLRVLFSDRNGTATLTPPSETGPNSPWALQPVWQQWGGIAGVSGRALSVYVANHVSASDSGSTTWACSSSEACYIIGLSISDGTSNEPEVGVSPDYQSETAQVIISAIAESHDATLTVDSVTGRGGGSGISVY